MFLRAAVVTPNTHQSNGRAGEAACSKIRPNDGMDTMQRKNSLGEYWDVLVAVILASIVPLAIWTFIALI